MPKKVRIPSYRLHKGSGQAVVVLDGRSVYLGKWGTPESKAAYERVVAEWLARHRAPSPAGRPGPADTPTGGLTVSELTPTYWRFAEGYCRPDGETTSELRCIREALRPLRTLYGPTPAAAFGPLALKAVRQKMIDRGWCRSHINHQVNRLRRVFRWAGAEELVPPSVNDAFRRVSVPPRGGAACGRAGRSSRPSGSTWRPSSRSAPAPSRPCSNSSG